MTDRRDFIKLMAALTAGLHLPYEALGQQSKASDPLGELLPMRRLGNTGSKVTMLGLGGYHIGSMSERDAQETIEAAIEGGVRFFDTAEGYQDGESEKRYGKYLTPKYREHIFLMTKVEQKDAKSAMESLDASLKRLNTDYLDLWQAHTLESMEDVRNRVEGGVPEAMQKAKESGKVRHIGFTGHATPDAHALMLEKTDVYETCQMPINVLDPHYKSFIEKVLPTLVERKMGVLAMKVLGEGSFFNVPLPSSADQTEKQYLIPGRVGLADALNFAWTLPISTLITGPDNAGMLKEKIQLARSFQKISAEQRNQLIEKVADVATGGELEDYKYG